MKHLCIIVVGSLFFMGLFLGNAAPARGDDSLAAEKSSAEARKAHRGVAERVLSFYRNNISAVDGDRCPSYPSCSSYSVEAFRKHGFAMGWLMTVDRLIHEGREEMAVSPPVYSDGKLKIYDPVENNDFWWYHPAQRDHEKK